MLIPDHRISLFNSHDSEHTLVFRADKITGIIEIFDSLGVPAPQQPAYRSRVERPILEMFYCYAQIYDGSVDDSWRRDWVCAWPEVLKQQSATDSGAHAIRNIVDLIESDSVQHWHDAGTIEFASSPGCMIYSPLSTIARSGAVVIHSRPSYASTGSSWTMLLSLVQSRWPLAEQSLRISPWCWSHRRPLALISLSLISNYHIPHSQTNT